ncbi:MAG: hypothetical protein QGH69_05130 [Alphaproteobacteria bacterium]|jgi:hypothetical protein|nr:hypothetical protein [Alphaproteobacteria bacterium]
MATKNFYRKWRQEQQTAQWLRDRLRIAETKYTLSLIGCAVGMSGFLICGLLLIWGMS